MSNLALKRRRYFMHAAHPTVGVSMAHPIMVFECPAIRTPKVRAILDPRDHYLATRLENYLADYLGNNYTHRSIDWRCSTIKANELRTDKFADADSDCLVLFGHPSVMDKKDRRLLYEYWQNFGSLVVVRVADFALHGYGDYARELFGGEYQNEHLIAPTEINVLPQAKNHPLMKGIYNFILPAGGIHSFNFVPHEATPILFANVCGESLPVAWIRTCKSQRIFATSLGSPTDFRHPCFLRLLTNAILWTSH